jgi:hypothetical protein
MELSTFFAILLPIIGAGIGFLIKHFIEKRKELLNDVNRERRELYQKFVNLMIDILKSVKENKKSDSTQLLSELYDFYKKYILYASPKVINEFSNYFQYLYLINAKPQESDHKMHFEKLTRVMTAMRKDLGLTNKGLGKNGINLMRALVSDFDDVMK